MNVERLTGLPGSGRFWFWGLLIGLTTVALAIFLGIRLTSPSASVAQPAVARVAIDGVPANFPPTNGASAVGVTEDSRTIGALSPFVAFDGICDTTFDGFADSPGCFNDGIADFFMEVVFGNDNTNPSNPAGGLTPPYEPIYNDADSSGTVTNNDVRLSPVLASTGVVLSSQEKGKLSTVVCAGDADCTVTLTAFASNEMYTDASGDGNYTEKIFVAPEAVYRDVDSSGSVTNNDLRLRSGRHAGGAAAPTVVAGTTVSCPGDVDCSTTLTAFASTERYRDIPTSATGSPDGVYTAGFDFGAWQLELGYDTSVVTLVSVLHCNALSGGFDLYIEKAAKQSTCSLVPAVADTATGRVFGVSQLAPVMAGANRVGRLVSIGFDGLVADGASCIDPLSTSISFFVTVDGASYPFQSFEGSAIVIGSASTPTCPAPTVVDIDIKPGGDPNSINAASQGLIPVAILSTATFDATAVDGTTVVFGSAGATPAHDQTDPVVVANHQRDEDGDGLTDYVLHFRMGDTGISEGDTEACLTGQTFSGIPIEGCDPVRIVPPWLDSDLDGWGDAVEADLATDQFAACPTSPGHDAWPPDSNGNGIVGIDDVFFVASRFGAAFGDLSYQSRAEIASQDGVIAIDDLFAFASRVGQSC